MEDKNRRNTREISENCHLEVQRNDPLNQTLRTSIILPKENGKHRERDNPSNGKIWNHRVNIANTDIIGTPKR